MIGRRSSAERQYAGTGPLAARIALHRRYSTATTDWYDVVAASLGLRALHAGQRVLEVGAGTGGAVGRAAARAAARRVGLVLSDRSPAMCAALADLLAGIRRGRRRSRRGHRRARRGTWRGARRRAAAAAARRRGRPGGRHPHALPRARRRSERRDRRVRPRARARRPAGRHDQRARAPAAARRATRARGRGRAVRGATGGGRRPPGFPGRTRRSRSRTDPRSCAATSRPSRSTAMTTRWSSTRPSRCWRTLTPCSSMACRPMSGPAWARCSPTSCAGTGSCASTRTWRCSSLTGDGGHDRRCTCLLRSRSGGPAGTGIRGSSWCHHRRGTSR